MKIVKDTEGTPTASTKAVQKFKATEGLSTNDTLTTGVTHEIFINGEKAWVKFEATTNIGDNEDSEIAKARLIDYVSTSVIDAIEAAVNTANNVGKE